MCFLQSVLGDIQGLRARAGSGGDRHVALALPPAAVGPRRRRNRRTTSDGRRIRSLLAVIAIPVAVVITAITIILIPIALLIALIFRLPGYSAWSRSVRKWATVSPKPSTRLGLRCSPSVFGTFILVLVVGLVGMIPCVGWLASFLVTLVVIGGVAMTLFGSRSAPGGMIWVVTRYYASES
jgi:hypothetical protein